MAVSCEICHGFAGGHRKGCPYYEPAPHSPEQEQTRCPTCGSDHPRHYEGVHQDCKDPFHETAPPGEQVDAESWTIRPRTEGSQLGYFEVEILGGPHDELTNQRVDELWNEPMVPAAALSQAQEELARVKADVTGLVEPQLLDQLKAAQNSLAQAQAERDRYKADWEGANAVAHGFQERIAELETALRKIAAPAGTSSTPAYWFQAIARAALSPIPSEGGNDG